MCQNVFADWDNEQISPNIPPLASNSYKLDLNVGASSVYLSRPLESPQLCEEEGEVIPQFESMEESEVVRPSEQRELAPESGEIFKHFCFIVVPKY